MSADEFDIIAKYFAPLATSYGARGLIDDVAVLETSGQLVITTDTIVEGVHFLPDDPLDTVAKKALRANLSDLAAKGAKPIAAVVNLVWPMTRAAEEIEMFARGLAEDLALYDIALLGGDTTSTPNGLVVSITAFGEPLSKRTPSRADAVVGEDVWVTGYIGDAYLGLKAIQAGESDEIAQALAERYRVPNPPVNLAATIATCGASMDVSDGLIADAFKMSAASRVKIVIDGDAVPMSSEARAWMEAHGEPPAALLSGGDDYQALFTAGAERREALSAIAVRIGYVEAGEGAYAQSKSGWQVVGSAAGYAHKLGR